MSRIPADVAEAVFERANALCERRECSGLVTMPMVYHHRQARAMGGGKGRNLDVAENLLYLHASCHEYIHAHPTWARDEGYIVSQYAETPS